MWNGTFFERSDLLTHQLTIDLCHYPDDCPSIPPNVETQMVFDPDMSDEADEANELSDEDLADRHQHSETSRSTAHPGHQSKLIIVSSTGVFKRWI